MNELSQQVQNPMGTEQSSDSHRGMIHYTQLPVGTPNSPLYLEGELYRREVGRLLAEGYEGKVVLIKGEEIIGIFDTMDEAREVGYTKFPRQPFLMRQILTWERLLRVGWMLRPYAASSVRHKH